MNKTSAVLLQIASLVFSASAFAAVEAKGQHEGLLLDSHIKYAKDAGGRETEAKVILNGESWTLVARTPQGNTLYGRTEKVASSGTVAAGAATVGANASSTSAATGNSDATLGADTSAPAAVTEASKQTASDGETIRVLYRELNEAGAEVESSAATSAIGSSTSVDLKDAHIESRVSKIRYQLE